MANQRGVTLTSKSCPMAGTDSLSQGPICRTLDLRLYWKDQDGVRYGSFEQLKKQLAAKGKRLLFATNAGMFNPDFTPCGLHIEEGRELSSLNLSDGDGNFYLKPNGVFRVDQTGASIADSTTASCDYSGVHLATQSGPPLVIDGQINALFPKDSENRRIRSGVGVVDKDHVLFVLSREPVTFHEIAVLFKQTLNCRQALYLDGVISDFYPPNDPNTASTSEYAGILGVTVRE